jgi:photosystem II stability/assembly factor-like uncharacterized protein
MIHTRIITTAACLLLTACEVIPFHPDVPQGGRAVAIAVNPGNALELHVASETGGVFRTADGGAKWTHVGGLPSFNVADLEYSPVTASVVLAAARSDYKATNNGCIWRSTDGGNTWTQPAGSCPAPSARCPDQPNAHDVSFVPGTRTVYVGTDCGVSTSADDGLTWSHLAPNPAAPANAERNQNRVWSVLAQTGGRVNLAADDGLWFTTTSGTSWTRTTTSPGSAQGGITHAFAASPHAAEHLFVASWNNALYLSVDGGLTWTHQGAPSVWARPSFVRIPRFTDSSGTFDVYWGSGNWLYRRTYQHQPSGPVATTDWIGLTADHADPSDVAFQSRTPILLATDGGVHRTSDGGANWTLTGGGKGGFNALQITEVTGQEVSGSSPHLDLYYGTQDNNNVASADGGSTWPTQMCCEGFFIRTAPSSVDHAGTKVTGVTCVGCVNFMTGPHFAPYGHFPNAPDGDSDPFDLEGNPFLIRPGHYIQNTVNNDVTPLVNSLMLTQNNGATWSTAFTVDPPIAGPPVIAGPGHDPTVYLPVSRPGTTPAGLNRTGIIRARDLYVAGGGTVTAADQGDFGSLGIFATMFAWYKPFGVSPRRPGFLIAPDIGNDQMRWSTDSGVSWADNSALTQAVTANGEYAFRRSYFTLASAIGFDPYDACHILVGTVQNGILRSVDGGRSWKPVRDSRAIPYVSSFYFPSQGTVVVSSYGRGLWTLARIRHRNRCEPLILGPIIHAVVTITDPATGAAVPLKDFGDPEICPACRYIIVRNGAIRDARIEGGRVREIEMVGGTIYEFSRNGEPQRLSIPNTYATKAEGEGLRANRVVAQALRERRYLRGLVVEGDVLRSVILSSSELTLGPKRFPQLQAVGKFPMATNAIVESGESITLTGQNFSDADAYRNLVVSLSGRVVVEKVPIDAQGNFRMTVPIDALPGDYDLVVEGTDGLRRFRETVLVKVVVRDAEEHEEKRR